MSILTANLDDIVFEGRNKAYGAYQLRRDYQSNMAKASGLTLGLCGLLFAAWVAWPAAQVPPVLITEKPLVDPIRPPVMETEKPKQAVLAPAHPQPRAAAAPPAPAIATRVAPDELVPLPPAEKPQQKTPVDGAAGIATPGTADGLAAGAATGLPTGTTDGEAKPDVAPAATEAFTFVEKMPEFAGGQAALLRYLRDHLRYPSQALREQAEGRVFMSFVVRADGTIAEATVLKGLGYGLDEEALRVVRQMPAWTPGYQAQHAVAVRFTLPITFKIQ